MKPWEVWTWEFPQAGAHPAVVLATAERARLKPRVSVLFRARAKAKGQPVFSVAVADFFNEPVIHQIDLAAYTGKLGETIKIRASDDFQGNAETLKR